MTNQSEVVIVGAGPAGSAAAIVLARAGCSVSVFDKASFPREKCCGDGLTSLALRELEKLGFEPSTVPSWNPVDEFVLTSPRGRQTRYPLPSDHGHHAVIAKRSDLDSALVDLARSAGATIHEDDALLDAVAEPAEVELSFRLSGSVRASHVIGADGMWSPLRRALGLSIDGYRGEWHAFRQYFHDVGPRAATELSVWFEPDILPGYVWSFPLPGNVANVGFGIQRGGAKSIQSMSRLWPDILARPHIREFIGESATGSDTHKAWPIPARVGRSPLVGPHTMFVGDAAAVTDPLTGEGIGQALLTGRLAAEAILSSDEAPTHYERAVNRKFVADDRMARALVPLLARPAIAGAVLRLTSTSGWTRRNFARWMFEDYPRGMIATPRRWHRGMFAGAGAFADH